MTPEQTGPEGTLAQGYRYDADSQIITTAEAVRRYGVSAGYPSEAAKCLSLVLPHLQGNVIDIGSGGWPVIPRAIQVELDAKRYADYTGGRAEDFPIQWHGDGEQLPFKDGVVDVSFSSHLLEDCYHEHWPAVLAEWSRVLKRGGKLVILTPDRQRWHDSLARGQCPNCAHHHEPIFGDVSKAGMAIGLKLIEERYCFPYPEYSVLTVFQRP